MKIVSTNISSVKTIVHEGKAVQTGIFKEPVETAVAIETRSIKGDEQADLINHGGAHKAIYAYSADHYAYWKETLETTELPYGAFGENFTVTGLSEENIHIGDKIRFGTALLEVSQPRIPCFKLGIALKNKSAPKLFINNGAPGVYFRVIEPGHAQTGDTIHIEQKSSHNISVKTIFQAYFDKDYADSETILSAAHDLPTLAPPWKEMIAKRLFK